MPVVRLKCILTSASHSGTSLTGMFFCATDRAALSWLMPKDAFASTQKDNQ